MDFFFLVIIMMKCENGIRIWFIYLIKCDEVWNFFVYGDLFSIVIYG